MLNDAATILLRSSCRMALCVAFFASGPCLLGADEPGDWCILTEFGADLYPSVIVATSTFRADEEEKDSTLIGDSMGLIGAEVVAPHDRTKVKVEVQSQKLIQASSYEATLPKKGQAYQIYPLLRYDYDSLLRVRQPFPEHLTVRVTVDGEPLGEKQKRMLARSVNDCPFGVTDEDGEYTALDIMFAAYVNENHPFVDEILGEALNSGDTGSFAGYQGTPDDVKREMEAVWNALKKRGFVYSSITRPSWENESVYTQHVRLIGDSIKTAQANCVDGSVLFASIFRKIGLNPFLVTVPGHMFVGVYLDSENSDFACIETTMLADATFDEAVDAGNRTFKKNRRKLTSKKTADPAYAIVDIDEARKIGILPLREPKAE